jgi:uncharacterized protein YecE (DUF72 family)
MSDIRIGTSGWSYPSGPGAWNGIFYPTGRGRRRGFDELAFYAEHFDTVEVNTTFYRPPDAATTARWAQRTPSRFEFSLKLFQKFTHPGMFQKSAGPLLPDVEAPGAIPTVTLRDVDGFRTGIEPLVTVGKLGVLLAQFPASFKDTPEASDYLLWLLDAFREYPLAVELRHRTWSDAIGDTLTLLNTFGAAWVQIDEPKFRFSIRQNYLPNVKGFYYMRLHGRNAEKWWRHDHRDQRYDYLYTTEDLKPFAETATAVRALVKKMYLYMNNHFAAKAVANATVLKHQVGQPIDGEFTPEMLATYPFLTDLVTMPVPPPSDVASRSHA